MAQILPRASAAIPLARIDAAIHLHDHPGDDHRPAPMLNARRDRQLCAVNLSGGPYNC
jgi:hypothetical protein